jgi:hypothetical protein
MVGPDKHDQHVAITHTTEITGSDDDIIREELARRVEFDKRHKETLTRLLIRPAARESEQNRRRKQAVAQSTREISRRFAFDRDYPGIYKTAEERYQAYAVFHPATVLEEHFGPNLKVFAPAE